VFCFIWKDLKTRFSWVVTLSSSETAWRFGGTYQAAASAAKSNTGKKPIGNAVSLAEAICSSETSGCLRMHDVATHSRGCEILDPAWWVGASRFAHTVKSKGGKSKKPQYSRFCASDVPNSFGNYICFPPQVLQWLRLVLWNGYNSVDIATWLGSGWEFILSPLKSRPPLGPPGHLSKEYGVLVLYSRR
jgi:hypothetical protein